MQRYVQKKEFPLIQSLRFKQAAGFTLVEIMIVVLIIGILLAIANLKQIDSATQQWCMDKQKSASNYTVPVIATDLVGTSAYIRALPVCPSTGLATSYTASATITGSPLCSVGTAGTGDYAGPNSTTSVATPGKFYHGL